MDSGSDIDILAMLAGGVGGDDEDLEPKKKRQRNNNLFEIYQT